MTYELQMTMAEQKDHLADESLFFSFFKSKAAYISARIQLRS